MTYTPKPGRGAKTFIAFGWAVLAAAMAGLLTNQMWLGMVIMGAFGALGLYTTLMLTPVISRMTVTPDRLIVRLWPRLYDLRWDDIAEIEFQHLRDDARADQMRAILRDGSHTRWISLMHWISNEDTDWPERILEQVDRHTIKMSDAAKANLLTCFTVGHRDGFTTDLDLARARVAERRLRRTG